MQNLEKMAKTLLKQPIKILEQENFDLMYSFVKHYSNMDHPVRTDIVEIISKAMDELHKKSKI